MKKRSDKNSATSPVVGFAGVIDDAILHAAGIELRSDKVTPELQQVYLRNGNSTTKLWIKTSY